MTDATLRPATAYAPAADATMLAYFEARAAAHPDRVALRPLGTVAGAPMTWAEWRDASHAVAAALVADGLERGERVAIVAGNGLHWPVADLAVLMAGGISVGVYPTSAPTQVAQILGDSGATVAIADTGEQLAKVRAVRATLPALRTVVIGSGTPQAGEETWDTLLARGRSLLDGDARTAAEVERRTGAARPDDVALLIYTSGSTGEPKGARIPHRYVTASATAIRDVLALRETDSALSFLPYCHAGERVFGLYTRVLAGMETGLVEDAGAVWDAARKFHPTVFGGLPRFWEKVYEGLLDARGTLDAAGRASWDEAIALGRQRSALRRVGAPVPDALEAAWRVAIAPARVVTHRWLGDRVRVATSGGAALPAEVAEYLDAVGVTVLGAYGMTEHLCVAFHAPDRYRFDTVGAPMPGTELRIDDDGEVLLRRGPLTFAGYHGRPDATAEAFTPDGAWLRTGDLGALEPDGTLRITGRKKELIALATGKKVAPLPIEARLSADPWIAQAVLHGEGRKYVTALLVPRRGTVETWAREEGLALPWDALLAHPDVLARLWAAVDRVNADLSRTERVRRFAVLGRELSVDEDELTPTLKVRRNRVVERYRDRLEALYEEQNA